jgi:hypothetical protein
MVRVDTLARARRLDRPDTAYIVRFAGRDGTVDTELDWAELARDTEWVATQLRGLGLAAGQRALLTGSGAEGPWLRPLMDALRLIGVTYGIAEGMGWDSNRTVVFARELALHAVIGLPEPIVERLGDDARLRELFGATPVVLAHPEALSSLRLAQIPAGTLCYLGPTLAIECAQRQGAHVNGAEWHVDERDGELWISGAGLRVGRLGETPLAIRGRVATTGCGCGSQDPRVILS